jgi:hypothetical protein
MELNKQETKYLKRILKEYNIEYDLAGRIWKKVILEKFILLMP